MKLNPLELLSKLNATYWFVPLLVTLGGIGLGIGLLVVDAYVNYDPWTPLGEIYPSSAEGARALLSAIIGAMITAISVTFSVTIVALTVAAQHFGPRVLNNFVRHTSAKIVLGTFIATFAYAVLVLGAVEGTGETATVPKVALTGTVALVVVAVGALIYYVHHVSLSLQVGHLALEMSHELVEAVRRLRDTQGRRQPDDTAPADGPPPESRAIPAVESGYLQRIDYDAIVEEAAAHGAVVWMHRGPGGFVAATTALAYVVPPSAWDDRLVETVNGACIVGSDRTLWHDPEFAVKQLVEVALRALSPGVNEAFTAITCIDRLREGLAVSIASPVPRCWFHDREGRRRLYVESQTFPDLLDAAFHPIRIFIGPNPAVAARLLESLSVLAPLSRRREDLAALRRHADLVRRTAERDISDAYDREFVGRSHDDTLRRIDAAAARLAHAAEGAESSLPTRRE